MEDGKVWVDMYSFPKDFEGRTFLEWKKKNPYANLDPMTDLNKDACRLYIKYNEESKTYTMKNEAETICPIFNPLAPFDKIWFHFEITAARSLAYNKHYTPDGKLIIDYTSEPLQMDKIKSNPKTF